MAKGLLKLNQEGIELEYQVQDSFVGIFKSEVKTMLVPYGDLESIHFKKGWFSGKITLKTSSLHLMQELPGSEQGECVLKVKRKHREEARQTISQARIALSEQKLDQLENGDDDSKNLNKKPLQGFEL
ncbi:MAG: hypothetical protein U5J63_16265 [Fodinibius sp.]|nr:hypothetical protein [Fodinibius sp.]